jgi:hypothetical protein
MGRFAKAARCKRADGGNALPRFFRSSGKNPPAKKACTALQNELSAAGC